MKEWKTFYIQKRTYLTGRFKGKYIGHLAPSENDSLEHDIYDIEIISGEILVSEFHGNLQKHDEADKAWKEQLDSSPVYNAKIPSSLPVKLSDINGATKTFNVAILEKRLQNIELSSQVYDGDKVYGDIHAEISGFVQHYIAEKRLVDVTIPLPEVLPTDIETGHQQWHNGLIRKEKLNTDGSKRWGEWQKDAVPISKKERVRPRSSNDGCWGVIHEIIRLLLLALIIIPIIVYGWRILLPIVLIVGIIYLMSAIGSIVFNVFRWIFYLGSLALMLAVGIGIFNLFMKVIEAPRITPPLTQDKEEETTDTEYDPITQDSLIVHHRIWQDYEGKEYEMDIKIRKSSYISASAYRNNLPYSGSSNLAYNQMVDQLHRHDLGMLDLVYQSLDSLKKEHNLNSTEFAEVVVSMIQDIPYTLILPDRCNANSYNDPWLRDYINSGQACQGDIKYGILSPIEFLGSLDGDCDTRTLLLYSILSHYKYDVVMLKSEVYMHSILGVNLPTSGQTKVINGVPYVLWETTATNLPPGLIDQNMSNLAYWDIALIH